MKNSVINLFTNKLTIVIIVTLFFSNLVASYAYFVFSSSSKGDINEDLAKVNLTINVNKVYPISTGYMVPLASNNNAIGVALNNKCIDENSNIVCQVYKITIKNDVGTTNEVIDGKVSFYSNSSLTQNSYNTMPNLNWKLIDFDSSNNLTLGENDNNIASSTPRNFVSNLTLKPTKKADFYIIIWLVETESNQTDQENSFYGKIEFNSSNGTGVTATF
jgi:hypothetical protein